MIKKITLLLLLCWSMGVKANLRVVQSGKWNDAATWSGGVIPSISDTCHIGVGFEVILDQDSLSCIVLQLEGAIKFNTVAKYFKVSLLKTSKASRFVSSYLGSVEVDQFVVLDTVILEGINIKVNDFFDLHGRVKFRRKSGVIDIHNLNVRSGGIWESQEDRAFRLSGSCSNEGQFLAGKGWYTFGDSTILGGAHVWEFSKMKLEGILFNQSKLFVKNEVKGLDKVIRNESQAKFETTCAPNAFEVSLDLRASGNWAYFSRMEILSEI